MRPANLKTKIFLDSGDPEETREAIKLLGFLDGQTTNPSLVAKNPATAGKKFSKTEILDFYKGVVQEVSGLIPEGSVSIEVYADSGTSFSEMLTQGSEFYSWIPNAHIKYPTTTEGLAAAELSVKKGMRVNMTLVFSQEQATAVYAATRGAQKGQVFLSPFVGRLDDLGQNGMDLIKNIIEMYQDSDHHVEVLTASVRSVEHMRQALELGSDIVTAPLKILKEFAPHLTSPTQPTPKAITLSGDPGKGGGKNTGDYLPPGGKGLREEGNLKPIHYEELDINRDWREFNIKHDLTDKGIEKFAADWNSLIKS
ncbi:MAG: transaldolase [Candidatus Doudnabacteria bacterium RIFCSPHIGHO2_01_FULL_46_14]|uniref:Transaldolase n=1 Tax=Candidatus Doudnabacteria bacterium RIFCSPHIGHO2_01_FULL_46_14 TaxID=1817824 RepID=A0A1F5NPD5_9BACT|nr:MAG: transaldolase [Candidatus Doudnabacteria bacterium RIFCSPHIGHO2_01_FULL_46_14]